MLSYRIDTAPTAPAHQVSADLRTLLGVLPQLTITLVQLRAPFRDPPVAVTVLSVPDAARPALERRLVPRWFGEAPAPLQQVRAVAMRPEWSWGALLIPRPEAVPLAALVGAHWPSARLDLHATARGCAARLWACAAPSDEARTAIREAGWRLVPLARVPGWLQPLLLRLVVAAGRAPDLTLELAARPAATAAQDAPPAEDQAEEALPPVTTPAAWALAASWAAGHGQPAPAAAAPAPTPSPDPADAGGDPDGGPVTKGGDPDGGPADPADAGGDLDELEVWPRGPGRLTPHALEALVLRLVDERYEHDGVTRSQLKSAGAGPDADALLAWLDAADLLAAPQDDTPAARWCEPRELRLSDPRLIAEWLRDTPLPDDELVEQVRAAAQPTKRRAS